MSVTDAQWKLNEVLALSDIEFTRAQGEHLRSGILFWVRATLNGRLRLDGLTVRKTVCGGTRLTFPARHDSWDREHSYIRPLDAETHSAIERQVFAAIGIKGGTTP